MSELPSKRRQSGFTMFELVMAMSIAAILATIAIPGFKFVTTSNRIATEVNGLLGDLQFARSEAVKEGQTVTVCPSTGPLYNTCSNSSNWATGWIVFLDTNNNQAVNAGEAIIRTQPAFGGTDTFVAAPASFHSITYNRMGFGPTPNAVNIKLHDSTSNSNWTRCVAISSMGSAVTERFGLGTPACN